MSGYIEFKNFESPEGIYLVVSTDLYPIIPRADLQGACISAAVADFMASLIAA